MADEGSQANEVFRRSTMNRIASADELDHYIKVSNPSAWVVTLAALLLIIGIIVWAVVAIVPVTVNVTGILLDNSQSATTDRVVLCMVDKPTADKIEKSGAKAVVDDIEAKSVAVESTPVSKAEIVSFLHSEYYTEALNLSGWNYIVSILLDEEPEHSDFMIGTNVGETYLVPVSIVVYETHPINIVLGKG